MEGGGWKDYVEYMWSLTYLTLIIVFFHRVQSVKPTQLNVKYNLWRGRVHCTLTVDDDVVINDVTMTLSGKPGKKSLAFSNVSTDSVLKARVVKIKEQQVTRYIVNGECGVVENFVTN